MQTRGSISGKGAGLLERVVLTENLNILITLILSVFSKSKKKKQTNFLRRTAAQPLGLGSPGALVNVALGPHPLPLWLSGSGLASENLRLCQVPRYHC